VLGFEDDYNFFEGLNGVSKCSNELLQIEPPNLKHDLLLCFFDISQSEKKVLFFQSDESKSLKFVA